MRAWIVLGVLALASCGGEEQSPEEAEQEAQRDIAMVERANNVMPPVEEITPEPIGAPDIERYDLYGAACNYAPGTSLGTRVVAREADAFIKIDGEVERFAADAGARSLPMRTRSLYNGREYALRLQLTETASEPGGEPQFEGAVRLVDKYGRVVYEGSGLAECRA